MELSTEYDHQLLQMKAGLAGLRLDANETALLDRQLKHMEAQAYMVEYAELRHTRYLPQDSSTPEGADSILYRVQDQIRKASFITDFANDLPNVDVVLSEVPIPIKPIGNSFVYSHRDLQKAVFSGEPIDQLRAQASRDGIEQKLDEVATFGDSSVGLLGFVNNAAVAVLTAATDGDSKITWADKKNGNVSVGSGAQSIIADLNAMRSNIVVGTKNLYAPNTILMATELMELISTTPFSPGGGSDRTILEWFKTNNPGVEVEGWHALDAANAAGTAGRVLSYFKDPRILVEKAVMAYRQLPPEARALAFVVNAWALTGGTHIYRPQAVAYLDGAN